MACDRTTSLEKQIYREAILRSTYRVRQGDLRLDGVMQLGNQRKAGGNPVGHVRFMIGQIPIIPS